jgi:NADP-dependent 3-hydroxy acid dehydrogenase YdfG
LKAETVVVTGASSGIGHATAIAFAARGANMVLAARRQALLDQIRQEVEALGAQVLSVPTDVRDWKQVDSLAEVSLKRFGTIDVLVAYAGPCFRRPVRELTVKHIEDVMAVNFYGCLHCILEVLPIMVEQGSGHLVVVSSVDATKGVPPDDAYVASEFAITALADVPRQELGGTGVHLSTIFPARIDTPMLADVQVPPIIPTIPPEKVAEAIVKAVLKRKTELYIPRLSSRTFVLASALAPVTTDWLIRRLRLGGWGGD